MTSYTVSSMGKCFIVNAKQVTKTEDELIFLSDDKVVAVFKNWDCWIQQV